MVVRSCLVLLFLLGVVGQCAARRNYRQTSRLLMRTPQEHSGSVLLHRQFVQHNIVARDFLPQRPLWEVALEMNLKQHDTALISPLLGVYSERTNLFRRFSWRIFLFRKLERSKIATCRLFLPIPCTRYHTQCGSCLECECRVRTYLAYAAVDFWCGGGV